MEFNRLQDLCYLLWFSSDEAMDYGIGPPLTRLEHDGIACKGRHVPASYLTRYLEIADRVRNRDKIRRSCMFPELQKQLRGMPGVHQSWLLEGTRALL